MTEQQKTPNKSFPLLKLMNSDHESYFDEEIAKYLIGNISVKELDTVSPLYSNSVRNFKLTTNFFGQILTSQLYNIQENNLNKLNTWINILKEKEPTLNEVPTFNFQPNYPSEQCPKSSKTEATISSDFHTYFAIHNLDKWAKKQDQIFLGKPFSDVNCSVITMHLLSKDVTTMYRYYPQSDKDKIVPELLFGHILKGKEDLINSKWHDEITFTSKLLQSESVLSILPYVSDESIFKLFNKEHLGIIIKYTNKDHPLLLGRLLPIASAELWLKSWNKEKSTPQNHVDIIKLFNGIFYKAYGLNIDFDTKKGMKNERFRLDVKAIDSLKEQLDFFLPAIVNMDYDKIGMCHLFNSIMRAKDSELMELCLKYKELPTSDEHGSIAYRRLHEQMTKTLNESNEVYFGDIKCSSWKEWMSVKLMDTLDKSLTENSGSSKKIKI